MEHMAYRHMKEQTTMVQYMVNLETCPDGATRSAILELRQLFVELEANLNILTGNITGEDEGSDTPTKSSASKRRRTKAAES